MNLKKIGEVFTSKFVGTGPSSYKKGVYRSAVSQRLRNTALHHRTPPLRHHVVWYIVINIFDNTLPVSSTLKTGVVCFSEMLATTH